MMDNRVSLVEDEIRVEAVKQPDTNADWGYGKFISKRRLPKEPHFRSCHLPVALSAGSVEINQRYFLACFLRDNPRPTKPRPNKANVPGSGTRVT